MFSRERWIAFLIMIPCFLQCALAQSVVLSAAPASGAVGNLTSFNLSVAAAGGAQPVALQWTIGYSPSDISSLSLSIAGAAASASKTLACAQATGSITCVVYGMNTTVIADGVIAQVQLALSPTTLAASTAVQVGGVVAASAAGDSIAATGTGSQISIQSSAKLTSLACSPATIIGPGSVNCTVSLDGAATVAYPVVLSSSNANLTVPAIITVAGGSQAASFQANAAVVPANQIAVISASANGVQRSSQVLLSAPAQLTSLSCNPVKIPSGTSGICTVALSEAGPAGGAVVALSGGNAVLAVPASVTVAPATTSATFAVAASGTLTQLVPLTASWNGTQVAVSVTVLASGPTFSLLGNPSEAHGVANGSLVTPTIAPPGLTGTVIATGTGSVNFAPDQNGNGVYFLGCCASINNAYYKFTGTAVGSIFDFNRGQISFSLTSRYNFAERTSSPPFRTVVDVRDGDPSNHLITFLTQPVNGRMAFSYLVGRAPISYYLPKGFEDTLFGSGVTIQVTLTWTRDTLNLYLNGSLVQSSTYSAPVPNWTSDSILDLGGYEFYSFGGYDTCDDIIAGFTVGPVTQEL